MVTHAIYRASDAADALGIEVGQIAKSLIFRAVPSGRAVLVVAADQDYTPVAHKEAYTKLIPGARLVVIPDARHATPVEHPEAFNAILRDFLEKRG